MSNKTNLQNFNAKYESLIEELRGKAVGGGSSGQTSVAFVETLTISSSAAGNVIYPLLDPTTLEIKVGSQALSYMSGRYRVMIGPVILNAPLIVLTTGSPSASSMGHTVTTEASGSGYCVYSVAKSESSGDPDDPDGPLAPQDCLNIQSKGNGRPFY